MTAFKSSHPYFFKNNASDKMVVLVVISEKEMAYNKDLLKCENDF